MRIVHGVSEFRSLSPGANTARDCFLQFNRVKINVKKTLNEVALCFHCRRMISIFPVRSLAILPLIVFLPRSPSYQLDRVRNHLSFADISDQKVDVVRGHHIVEHTQPIALLGLEKPPQVSAPVPDEFQKKLLLVAPACRVVAEGVA